MKSAKKNWVIAKCCSGADGVSVYPCYGTKNQVKRYMMKLIREERACNKGDYEFGTNSVKELEGNHLAEGELYGVNCFYDCHTDYSAYRMSDLGIEDLSLSQAAR